jgi:hypothetical protein
MLPKNKGLIYLLLWVSILVISSCSPKFTTPRTGEEFSREISRLEKISTEDPDPSVRAKSHLQLGRLYTHYKNPQRDYLKGCQEFEAYLALVPADRKNDDLQDWISVLKELEKSERELKKSEKEAAGLKGKMGSLTGELNLQVEKNQELQVGMDKLQSRLESLEKTNRSLSEANRSLKEAMEMLNKLDQEMEKKRRSIR